MTPVENSQLNADGALEVCKNKTLLLSRIYWKGTLGMPLLHMCALHGVYLICASKVHLYTVIFQTVLLPVTILGVTAGAHRLWSHKAYQATWPLRLFLATVQTMAFHGSVRFWVRTHRLHHKFTDTVADPHDSTRGFFFCHIGWMMTDPTPEFWQKKNEVDLKDIDSDPITYWQARLYFQVWWPIFFVFLPTAIPVYFWNEAVIAAWHLNMLRFIIGMHQFFLINSMAHSSGMKPYDRNISAIESIHVALHTMGEGWHNYHHVFPWDYKAAELPGYLQYNPTTCFIDVCAYLGLAYNLRTVSKEQLAKRRLRTGTEMAEDFHEE